MASRRPQQERPKSPRRRALRDRPGGAGAAGSETLGRKIIFLASASLAVVAVLAAIGAGVLWWAKRDARNKGDRVEPFDAHMAAYHEQYERLTGRGGAPPAGPVYRRGRLLVIEAPVAFSATGVDPEYFELPAHLAATSPDDVGTLVVVDRTLHKVGVYLTEDEAERSDRRGLSPHPAVRRAPTARVEVSEVFVIDRGADRLVGRRRFEAPEPPEQSRGRASVTNTVAAGAIARWLAGLPERL